MSNLFQVSDSQMVAEFPSGGISQNILDAQHQHLCLVCQGAQEMLAERVSHGRNESSFCNLENADFLNWSMTMNGHSITHLKGSAKSERELEIIEFE